MSVEERTDRSQAQLASESNKDAKRPEKPETLKSRVFRTRIGFNRRTRIGFISFFSDKKRRVILTKNRNSITKKSLCPSTKISMS